MSNIWMEIAQNVGLSISAGSMFVKLGVYLLCTPALIFGILSTKKKKQSKKTVRLGKGEDNIEEIAAATGLALHLHMDETAAAIGLALHLYKDKQKSGRLTINRIPFSPWKQAGRTRSMERL